MRLRILALVAALCVVGAGWALADVSLGKWWQSEPQGYKQALGLSDDQARRIERTFQSFFPQLDVALREFKAAESALHTRMEEDKADEVTVEDAVERMEVARRRMAITRQTLRFQTHRLLSAEQRTKLEEIRARVTTQRRRASR